MTLQRYEFMRQRGAGADGVAYEARAADRKNVEVCLLAAMPCNRQHWAAVAKRLRTVALLDQPAARRIIEFALDAEPPFLALEDAGDSLADERRQQHAWTGDEALAWTASLADGLTAAHRLGLSHGTLSPVTVYLTADRQPKIDFTGLDCGTTATIDDLAKIATAPELTARGAATPAADVYALGALLTWLLTGQSRLTLVDEPAALLSQTSDGDPLRRTADLTQTADQAPPRPAGLNELIRTMTSADPENRPSAADVAAQLRVMRGSAPRMTGRPESAANLFVTQDAPPAKPTLAATGDFDAALASAGAAVADVSQRERLGRFRLLNKLGEGGMGAVYKAEDVTDGSVVAIKVLNPKAAYQASLLQRFHKEARLLAEVNNPYVTNLLEVNEDDGIHYLAIEFVAGRTLSDLLSERGQLKEAEALAIVADVCRALVDAHQRGIVHRDVKPENILIKTTEDMENTGKRQTTSSFSVSSVVKLSDFGLARHVVETESLNVTRAGAILGTPLYMAPEQCSGSGKIDPRTDVYALGATLFHLLAGRPPFLGDGPLQVIAMHCNEPPPALRKLVPELSEAICQIVEKCLAKAPDLRFPDAGALLVDLERLLRGEPTTIVAHPRLPDCNPDKVLQYDWSWELDAAPAQLWPHVSNTERFNRAIGLSAIHWETAPDDKGRVHRSGKFRKVGMMMAWEEHPFEWIEGRRFGVLREFKQGPFKWFMSQVEMAPRPGGGTLLTHRINIEPIGLLGRTAAAVDVGVRTKKAIDRVYRRIDAALTGKLGNQALADPFEEPAALSSAQQQRLDDLVERLITRGVDANVAEKLGEYLAVAPDQAVARIRPLALARSLGLDPDQTVAACLHGAREGLLVVLWDILCPICRIPSEVKDTLKALKDHGRCDACNLDYDLDFANSVEMIFRVHPAIRPCELGIYCIGGPAHSPHVAAQVRVAPKERMVLDLALSEGSYRLRGPQLPFTLDFRVQPSAPATRWELDLSRGPRPDLPRALKPGTQVLALTNDHDRELVVRVERTVQRHDALTAARASALALFRELFPGEVLSPGQLISVATVTLLVTSLEGAGDLYERWGDAKAFGLLHEHFRLLDEQIRREGGALIKTIGEGVLAAFPDPLSAVRVALAIADWGMRLADSEPQASSPAEVRHSPSAIGNLSVRVAVHRGAAMAATLNDHLDYFGTTVNTAWRLLDLAKGGQTILSDGVTDDPQVVALLRSRSLSGEIVAGAAKGAGFAQRFTSA